MNIRSASSLFVVAILSACPALAQNSSFEKVVPAPLLSFDAFARAAQVAPDQGRCVFATNALIGQLGDADVLMLRVNGAGDIVQSLTIGDTTGQGYHDVAKEVVQSDKHYYVSGYTRAIDTSAAHTFTAFLIKVDTALNFKWQKNYILPGQEMYAEVMTPIGGSDLLVAGKIYDGNDFQSFLMRTDSTGAVQWIKQYQMPFGETIQCVRPLPGGDLLMSGSMIFGFELVLPFVCKVTAQGDWIWGKYYNYPPMSIVENSSFLFVRAASANDILLAGHTDVFGAGSLDAYVVNIDSSGRSTGRGHTAAHNSTFRTRCSSMWRRTNWSWRVTPAPSHPAERRTPWPCASRQEAPCWRPRSTAIRRPCNKRHCTTVRASPRTSAC
ncbi:MAG: hypothetical protein IPO17_16325 [Flavobacteriales bacterium]|nr:hypothetical protein [Flavobacteriales bacterium]